MKCIHLLGSLLAGITCAACSEGMDPAQLENHFLRHLQGEESPFASEYKVAKEEIADCRQVVWSAWQQANSRFEEDKLPVLSPLSEKKDFKWPLPEALEPHAVMPFYYGTKGEKPESGWPMFLYIHGSGDKEHEWSASYSYANKFEDAPSVYFIPQIPNTGKYYRWWQKAKLFAWERLIRLSFADGEFDPNRFYMIGISEGGYGSQRLASFYADYLAAVGPMAGGEPAVQAPPENCGHIGFSLRTGAEDVMFERERLVREAKLAFDSLEQQYPGEYRHFIDVIPGRGHHIDYLPTPPWVRQFVRRLHPKHFIWIDYALDGQFRKGFYNLGIDERASDEVDLRTRYDVCIKENVVDLQVQKVVYEATYREPKWDIPITFEKHYSVAEKGGVTVFLNEDLVDFDKEVTVTVNGKVLFKGMVSPSLEAMVNSCACFFDPERVYPVAIDVKW